MDPKPTKNHGYKFQRIFTDGDFMAAGILVIPANESKPLKPARDNTYVRTRPFILISTYDHADLHQHCLSIFSLPKPGHPMHHRSSQSPLPQNRILNRSRRDV